MQKRNETPHNPNNERPQDASSNPWDSRHGYGQTNFCDAFNETIPEAWKNQALTTMPFTVEKCRDLK